MLLPPARTGAVPLAPGGAAPLSPGGALVPALAARGHRPALITKAGTVSYAQLADRVAGAAAKLGTGRRLVQIAAANDVEPLVAYLGALAAGHVVLLTPDETSRSARLAAAYDPDVVVAADAGGWTYVSRRDGSAHDLHPDLALLLSTSGTTGSPKLVRLSHANLLSNAAAIAESLGIRATDRAATTLPMHYCYGLSVVNSHLLRGATLILTDHSVLDRCFWALFRRAGGTTFAGVPHTFDLLDRIGFADMDLPHLRYVTQAGGRMAPETVRRFAELGQARGWDLVVMYGQTEATARMAVLPPDLAISRPQSIGGPIPGGALRVEPFEGAVAGTGELVYSGPNVMLGYAETPADLARGRTVAELRTGDVARQAADGLFEVVGRRARVAKVLGLRVDLGHVEAVLASDGIRACCVEAADGALAVAVEDPGGRPAVGRRVPAPRRSLDGAGTRALVASICGLPRHAVRVCVVPELPRLPSGKPDLQAVRELADLRAVTAVAPASPADGSSVAALRRTYAEALGVADVPASSSFVSLGGDSLSYVEISSRLEAALGHLPPDWHTTPIRELARAPRRPARSWRTLDTSIALRALAIVLVVGSHANVFAVLGGAHLLVAVAGFNAARFHLSEVARRERVRHLVGTVARVAVPTVVWIACAYALTAPYGLANLALVNFAVGSDALGPGWQFWFLEALVWILVGMAVLVSVPAVDRLERRWPFGFAAGVVALGLTTRVGVVDLPLGPQSTQSPLALVWLFGLGWLAARATTTWRRVVVAAVAVATVPGFFGELPREALVLAGVLCLLTVPSVRVPAIAHGPLGALASASLFIYLTHWQVFPHLQDRWPLAALAASILVGLAYWRLTVAATPLVRSTAATPLVRSTAARAAAGVARVAGGRVAGARVAASRREHARASGVATAARSHISV